MQDSSLWQAVLQRFYDRRREAVVSLLAADFGRDVDEDQLRMACAWLGELRLIEWHVASNGAIVGWIKTRGMDAIEVGWAGRPRATAEDTASRLALSRV